MAPPPSNRRTSTRQVRTSITRPTNYYARPFGPRGSISNADTPPANTAPGFCPAITHFTDSVAALPKELIKHFSMLKEVEAKANEPEKHVQTMFEEIARMTVPNRSQSHKNKAPSVDGAGTNSRAPSVAGSLPQDPFILHQKLQMELYPPNFEALPAEEQDSLRRRQLFLQLRQLIQSMLPTLDEKIHVLSSANQTLSKGLVRMNSSYKHLGEEISDEARFGSTTHWAYADKEEKKKTTTTERTRREVAANHLAAAAAAMQESEAASRSESRRDAMLAKRNRNHLVDSDFDDRPPSKKAHPTNRARKVPDASATNEARPNGLGISNATAPVPKRRKVEKTGVTSAPMERSMSTALKAAGKGSGGSPRETPAADAPKKRTRAPPTSAPAKKRIQGAGANSPMPSPAVATFKDIHTVDRPQSTRGRRGSTPNSAISKHDISGDRRSPSHHSNESRAVKDMSEATAERTRREQRKTHTPGASKIEATAKAKENDSAPSIPPKQNPIPASSPPAEHTIPESVPLVRSRSTRNKDKANGSSHASSESNGPSATTASKASHKKRASVASAAPEVTAPVAAPTQSNKREPESSSDEAAHSSAVGELSEMEVEDDGEERYCYCNGISYGHMIGCDNDDCPRGWFHWECVGIKRAPNEKTKWYCDECRDPAKKSRPVSRA